MARYKEFFKPWYTGEKIGDGGFGTVYKAAINRGDGYKEGYALKKLRISSAKDSVKRFQDEIRLLKILNHKNIVKMITNNDQKPYFFVCPLYQDNLRKRIPYLYRNDNKIKEVFNNIFDGIEYLHAEGIIHRDLKPDNILMNSESELVIADLGLVRDTKKVSTRRTQTGVAMGTFYYMAPEQFQNPKDVDKRADIYSIGKMIYECYGEILTSPHTDISKLPADIAKIYELCTAPKPDERFQTIHELRQMFNLILDARIYGMIDSNIDSVLQDMVISGPNDKNLIKVISYFQRSKNKPEFVTKIIMDFPEFVFVSLYQYNESIAQDMIGIFSEYTTQQNWTFNYTDTIGDKCKSLYKSIDNIKIRAKLTYIVLSVGCSHDRYYLFDLFKEILYYSKDDIVEAIEICNILYPIREKAVYASHHLIKSKLNDELLKLFE